MCHEYTFVYALTVMSIWNEIEMLSWTALDPLLLLLFIVVARIGIYQSKEFKIFSAESSSEAKSANSRTATQRTASSSNSADC